MVARSWSAPLAFGNWIDPSNTIPQEQNMVTVRMSSEVFGNEEFEYEDMDQAVDGIRRLVEKAESLGDGIERVIGVVVNAGDGDGNENDLDL
jgi:hypothetical protein